MAAVQAAEWLKSGVLTVKSGPLRMYDYAHASDDEARPESLAAQESIVAIIGDVFEIAGYKDQQAKRH